MCMSLQAIWHATEVDDGVQLSLTSPDGDQGYPGEVQVSVSYTLKVHYIFLYSVLLLFFFKVGFAFKVYSLNQPGKTRQLCMKYSRSLI